MPYILQQDRNVLDPRISDLAMALNLKSDNKTAGRCNYIITKLLLEVYEPRDYATYNEILGVLTAVTQELYRRKIAPYEDEAKERNGDVF